MIKLIVAVGPKNLIGNGNKMPWNIKEEFQHFKETTMNSWLLMGGNTYKGLPKKLENRKICVLSKEKHNVEKNISTEEEANEFIEKFKNSKETLWISGGKMVYETFYKKADELIVSEIDTDKSGNVYLNLDLSQYNKELVKTKEKFKVYRYTKKEQ